MKGKRGNERRRLGKTNGDNDVKEKIKNLGNKESTFDKTH